MVDDECRFAFGGGRDGRDRGEGAVELRRSTGGRHGAVSVVGGLGGPPEGVPRGQEHQSAVRFDELLEARLDAGERRGPLAACRAGKLCFGDGVFGILGLDVQRVGSAFALWFFQFSRSGMQLAG